MDENLIRQSESTLKQLKRRADRIFDSELARRPDALQLGQQFKMQIQVDNKTGESSMTGFSREIPPREPVSYALTLLRPFELMRDELYWKKVLAALETQFAVGDEQFSNEMEQLRAGWSAYPIRRVRIMQGPTGSTTPTIDMWDDEVARSYIYGDLVHGDNNDEILEALGDEEVLFAASAKASDGFILVNNTYQFLHRVRPDIAPRDAYFSTREEAK